LEITFFNQNVLDTPQFTQFISRIPTLEALEKAYVNFELNGAVVKLSSQTFGYGKLIVSEIAPHIRNLGTQGTSSDDWSVAACPPGA
jgi:hypothetical protein